MIVATNKNYTIKAIEKSKTTSGGIFIQSNDESQLAEILSVGPDVEKNIIPVGTHVVINWNGVIKIKVEGEECFIVHADNILGIVQNGL